MLALGIVFAACLPVFLIAVNVVYVTDSDWLYTYNWWRNGVPDRTGLTINELDSAADQIKDYSLTMLRGSMLLSTRHGAK